MEKKCRWCPLIGFLILALWALFLVVASVVAQETDYGFTAFLRENSHSDSIRGYIDVQRQGRVDFWVVKDGDFTTRDFGSAIVWVAIKLRQDKEIGDYAEGLYFRREKDRFSIAEIGARECIYVAELLERAGSEEEAEQLIKKAIRFTTKKR